MGVVQIVTATVAFAYTALAIGLFVRAGLGMLELVKLGAPDKTRRGERETRVKTMLRETLGHTRMLQWSGVGLAHWAVFFGFFLLFPALAQSYFEVLDPEWALPLVGHWGPWLLASEILTVLTGIAILALFAVRMLSQPRAHRVPPQGTASDDGQRRSSSRFENSRQWMAFYIEATIFTIVLSHMTIRTFKVALGDVAHEWTSPVSAAVAGVWSGASEDSLRTAVTLVAGLDILVSWTFFLMLALIPSMGIGWHRVTAFFNIYFKRNADGAVSLGPAKPMLIDGEPADFETADPETQPFGVATIGDFSWKGLLDFSTCTECGRCQSQCPAWNTGKPLSPKKLITDLRDHLYEQAPYLKAAAIAKERNGGEADPHEKINIIGNVIDPDVLWSCTTCGACVEQCPVDIEHVDHILDLRRNMVMIESDFPDEAQTMLRNLENKGNPWGENPAHRLKWAEPLDFEVPIAEAGGDFEYLYWVGCAGAYDPKAQKTSRAVATLLHDAGVKFAVLGEAETCTGDSARRIGHEFMYQMLAEQNVETLNEVGAVKIVATCPHCLNTIGNEYEDIGGKYEVVHHTELLNDLVNAGKITPVEEHEGKLTYHDPCYLGRHNRIFTPPRELLGSFAEVTEMPRTEERSFCCGAGGARMWLEEPLGKRVNRERADEAVATGAKTVAVGCPFCSTMLRDGVADAGREDVEVIDIAQLLARTQEKRAEKAVAAE
ncbi:MULTISPECIES: (Fe-S)-binding protein [Glycomyces]|uniref:(Fe-S)-binding protein n=2 Tax=Glycomyces TaxID=58113 RepID=A0A9X3PYB4_9ACTN|nr:(Fe-S)-binding protein [Glycomyces lechevalierae]MDA1388328.1 (Fe-S)-binding protein [Glycomyces lechevalierae]MDR7338716.1 Fe-S oxidoreductase [Glycomyces lechevalierae]